MISLLYYLFIFCLSLMVFLVINGDINYVVYALSFECIHINKLNLETNSYQNAIEIVKNSILPTFLRIEENVLLENEIYNTFNQEEYQILLKKRILFMAEYVKSYHAYYQMITRQIYNQSASYTEKAQMVNDLMSGFIHMWITEYNIFLKKALLREI